MQQTSEYQIPENKQAKEEDNQMRDIVSNFVQQAAMERIDRIYLVNPVKAKQVIQIILSQAQQGQVQPKSVTDEQIKQILEALQGPQQMGSKVVVGGIEDCCGDGKVVMKKRVEVLEGVKDLGDDELSF